MASDTQVTGRPRDTAIDEAVLDAALAELGAHGYSGFSLSAVAALAGTTRPALYRRWPDKSALVIDAIARLAAVDPPAATDDPFADLVAELEHFRHCISDTGALPLAGLMLGESVDPAVRDRYHALVVAPRRRRLRAVLERARRAGDLDAGADLAVAGSFLTGSWYSFALTGTPAPRDWARRVAELVWKALGGR